MRTVVLIILLTPLGALMAPAQTPIRWEQGSVSLDSGWRTHPGDQPEWAAPGFDDSLWQTTALDNAQSPTTGEFDRRWYRLRIDLPASHPPLALLLTGADATCEVFVNGRLLPGPALGSAWHMSWFPKARVLPIEGAGPVLFALRTRVPNAPIFFGDHNAFRVSLGTRRAIDDAARSERSSRINHVVIGVGVSLLLVFAALPLILLSRFQRDHREYLWIGLNLLFLAVSEIGWLTVDGFVPVWQILFIAEPAFCLALISQIEFTFSFAGRSVSLVWRAYEAALLLNCFLLPTLLWNGILGYLTYSVVDNLCNFPPSILLPVLLLVWYRRGNREAGWLILPSLLPLLSVCMIDLGVIGDQLNWQALAVLLNPIPIGSFFITPNDIADLVYLMAIGIVMFLRFNRVNQQQAHSAAELEAARRVQSLLLRPAHAYADRFSMEAVYLPAAEVGGDFFHTTEIDGRTRIVVGDVSGKGLGAAMLVATLIGSLDSNLVADPAALLMQLNELLLARQQGGFATCICASIDRDGLASFSNAGHLAPYLNGEEIPVEPGLPLGIAPGPAYTRFTFQLAPKDTLTFLSDGVVEARNQTGELFGFDRAAAISNRPAIAIAQTAQAFGQEDDITVLTLRYSPAEVLRA